MSEPNKTIVNQAYTNFQSGDIDALVALMADDVTWTLPEMEVVPFAGARTGRTSVAEFFESVAASQEALRFEPRELIAEGDRVTASVPYTWHVKANNREFRSDFAHAWTIRDGKAIDFREYMDTAACIAAHQKAMSA